MMDAIKNKLYPVIDAELKTANERFGLNHSDHESFAVIREEIDEAHEDLEQIEHLSAQLWKATKTNAGARVGYLYERIFETAVDMAVEAVQVAAMARKGIISNIEITRKRTKPEHEAEEAAYGADA